MNCLFRLMPNIVPSFGMHERIKMLSLIAKTSAQKNWFNCKYCKVSSELWGSSDLCCVNYSRGTGSTQDKYSS